MERLEQWVLPARGKSGLAVNQGFRTFRGCRMGRQSFGSNARFRA